MGGPGQISDAPAHYSMHVEGTKLLPAPKALSGTGGAAPACPGGLADQLTAGVRRQSQPLSTDPKGVLTSELKRWNCLLTPAVRRSAKALPETGGGAVAEAQADGVELPCSPCHG